MRVKEKFSFGFNLIWVVQSLSQKYLHSLLTQITSLFFASRPNTEGRFAIVTNVGQGMRWMRWHQRRMAPTADGEVVWS